jgi:hypothetical protein
MMAGTPTGTAAADRAWDRVEPTPQIPLVSPQIPMGKRAFEGILNEVVGRLLVAAQQRAGEPPQPGNLLFDQSGSIGHDLPV